MRSLSPFFHRLRCYFIAAMACIYEDRRMGKFLDEHGIAYTCEHQEEWRLYAEDNRWSRRLNEIRETDWSLGPN